MIIGWKNTNTIEYNYCTLKYNYRTLKYNYRALKTLNYRTQSQFAFYNYRLWKITVLEDGISKAFFRYSRAQW